MTAAINRVDVATLIIGSRVKGVAREHSFDNRHLYVDDNGFLSLVLSTTTTTTTGTDGNRTSTIITTVTSTTTPQVVSAEWL